MQTKNAINKIVKKGYTITEEKGLYTFVIDGRDYSFRDQFGSAILFQTHFEGAIHPEFFSNLTQLIRFAETDYSKTEEAVEETEKEVEIEAEEVKEVEEVIEVAEITEVIEASTLEDKNCYKLVRETDGHKFYAKAFDSREEAKFNSKYDCQAQIFEDGKWFNYSNYGYSEDYSTHPNEAEELDTLTPKANKSSFGKWLETMIDEKGVDVDSEITISVHYGITYKSLIEFLETVPKEHKKIKNTLVAIDFQNGNIFHYIKHLAECMISYVYGK